MNEWAFGYGSLVNERTWDLPVRLERAVLHGWRREWAHVIGPRSGRFCVLSITPQTDSRIEGLVAQSNDDIVAYLKIREAGYDKITVEPDSIDIESEASGAVTTHVSQGFRLTDTDDSAPIPQSYIDVVLDGYHQMFGESGVENFLNTTGGWRRPILNDRSHPIYSRAVTLSDDFATYVDDRVASVRSGE